jgi:hypothetical protein
MRRLLLTVIAGGVMAVTGMASAQTPPGPPPDATNPGVLAPGAAPAGVPSPQGRAAPAPPPPLSAQAQLEAQQKDIDALIKTVALLTQRLQLERSVTGTPAGSVAALQQVAAGGPPPAEAPGPAFSGQAAEDLQQMQQALAQLDAQRAAAPQAPAADQQKELELQRKQLDLLNRMVRLMAAELARQGPPVARMQTQVAALDARSKQAAQRDQELANAVDNLTEHVDVMQRFGTWLPAPLKELFDPSYNNETPLSIYGALVDDYHQFHPERWGVFSTPTFSTFFLLTLNERIFLEANVDLRATGVDVPWAQMDFWLTDWLTFVVGRYLVPIGFYNERLAFEWGNKLPDDPLMFHQVSPLASTDGVQFRGATYLGCSPVKLEYALWFGNGMELSSAPAALADLADLDVLAGSDETHAKAVGGRLGLWVPKWGVNGGVSGFFDYNYSIGPPNVLSLGMVSVDASYHRGNWDARFEAAYMNQQATPIIGRNIERSGLYCQLAYRPYDSSNRFVQRLEAVARYSLERFSAIDVTQLDFTKFSDLTFVPVDRNQYAFGLNYYVYPSLIFKFAYEINQELHGTNLDDNIFFAQVVWAF